jgi:hypothetical protein
MGPRTEVPFAFYIEKEVKHMDDIIEYGGKTYPLMFIETETGSVPIAPESLKEAIMDEGEYRDTEAKRIGEKIFTYAPDRCFDADISNKEFIELMVKIF